MASVYFNPAIGGDGSTVSDDDSPTTGLANGGHRTRFVPALAQLVAVSSYTVTYTGNAVTTSASNATLASQWATTLNALVSGSDYSAKEWAVGTTAQSAKYWAQTALNAPGTAATSTSSLTVGTGSKSLTLAQTGKAFVVGQYVQIVSTADTANWMVGAITAFDSGTGAMTVSVTYTGGAGTATAWAVTPAAPPELPTQSGQSGKFLSTNGSAASWQNIDQSIPLLALGII